MDWQQEAERRKEELLSELQELIAIPSVLNEDGNPGAPYGKEVREALDWFLEKGERAGFKVKNVDNVAGHLETGEGDELLGILGHVDVVPAGDGWTKDPFGGEIVDGKLYGRGAIDDKGPTIAAWLALKMVKDAGFEFKRRVRLIIGTDEESGFRCVERYFQTEEMPDIGFAPDADFPIINAEKGIADIQYTLGAAKTGELLEFTSGERTNMVPDRAVASLALEIGEMDTAFREFCEKEKVTGDCTPNADGTVLTVYGKSAHAMEPDAGVNAGILLAKFLQDKVTGDGSEFVRFITDYFSGDSRGRKLGLSFSDDASGDTTFNTGIMRFKAGERADVRVSMRYSVSCPFDELMAGHQIEGIKVDIVSNSKPHHVDAADPFIQTLQQAYEKQTGEPADLLAIGGGTYARVLDKGVAFGMLFPGELDVAHQADEFVDIDNLVKATAIYAEAIYQLACK
ncbi:dipeptidase PepV [Planococcus sp. CP5-4]|uniref:dipeptidase PepV n=1 Tax=unclassified Planococcus (in: firmicutes) TaxID=2662419 RepID=UPI001C24EFF8|nr:MULTISPECIES: dipeptidase PepV [unclassified Planococcus (in: firmicutes)]MBU9673043.1 dipeptidase PepV [Planococcus sp. CP5-4_YE]MBV0908815.1 dipeptidase PepV [Planococcus sp. CP5-4_UN]MBW6063584.1 dipeptidase PepV [Planococcus sp. CP5-4]